MGDQSKQLPADEVMPIQPLTPEEVQSLLPELDSAAVKAKFAPLLDGSLSESESAALQQEDALGFALFTPPPAHQVDALTARLLQEIGVSPEPAPLPAAPPERADVQSLAAARAYRTRRLKYTAMVGGPLLAIAFAAGLLLFPMAERPEYRVQEQISQPPSTLNIPEPSPVRTSAPTVLSPDQLLTLQLNPRKASAHNLGLRAYVERDGKLSPLPFFQQTDDAFLLRRSVRELFGAPTTGPVTVWIVVGAERALPKTPEQFGALQRSDPKGRSAGLFIDKKTYLLQGLPPAP